VKKCQKRPLRRRFYCYWHYPPHPASRVFLPLPDPQNISETIGNVLLSNISKHCDHYHHWHHHDTKGLTGMSSLNVPVCVYIQASKFDGNWTADSARKTGSEICSPQELIVTMAEGEIAEIANTMTVRHRGIPSECWRWQYLKIGYMLIDSDRRHDFGHLPFRSSMHPGALDTILLGTLYCTLPSTLVSALSGVFPLQKYKIDCR